MEEIYTFVFSHHQYPLQKRGFLYRSPAASLIKKADPSVNNRAAPGRRARRLQREKISFAGFFNGKILVKVSEGAETKRITSLADLDKFDQ
ncbi:hypothetical protein J6590_051523 [Homalodisca vitripennis]|nr:hypothetical protein J6590_051523 [Homalodisca vitripennis]